ncbi:hypothetical protein [Phreatobacter sp.]|uniref:hypothetical protein n=1 Tax=Phreatobacter sp. TaxID=1966341 RepID=UPI003F71B338
MAITRKEEARALSADELALVEKSHHPGLQELSDSDLRDLVRLVRERRDKAQTDVSRRRREARGKGAPKGATPSAGDAGSKTKLAVLAMAMRRLNGEAQRRKQIAATAATAAGMRKALEMKQASDQGPAFNSRHARSGMRDVGNTRAQNLVRPMERGRQRQAAKVAQARRDAR